MKYRASWIVAVCLGMLVPNFSFASRTLEEGPPLKSFVVAAKFHARNAHDCRQAFRRGTPYGVQLLDADGALLNEPEFCRRLFPNMGQNKIATDTESDCSIQIRHSFDVVATGLHPGFTQAQCQEACAEARRNAADVEKCLWRSAEEVAEDAEDEPEPLPMLNERAKKAK